MRQASPKRGCPFGSECEEREGARIKATITLRSAVTILAGPLKGMTGRVVRRVRLHQFVVLLDCLQRKGIVEVDEADLALMSEKPPKPHG